MVENGQVDVGTVRDIKRELLELEMVVWVLYKKYIERHDKGEQMRDT